MRNKRQSIRWKLLSIILLPTTLLGLAIFVFGIYLIYNFASDNIREELETATYVLKGCFDLTVRGDYTYDGDLLMKGDVNISDSTMLYDIKSNSAIDTTVFWGDTRVLTTVENEYGISAVGTKAEKEVADIVLSRGENYYSSNVTVNGSRYIGYYTPLLNDDQTIVGMVFAGKPAKTVYLGIGEIMLWFLIFTLLAILFAAVISRQFSEGLILDINRIKQYLHSISDGDFAVSVDDKITGRQDEIGEIGIYADKMRMALKTLVELDALTSLYNRRSCNNRLQTLVKKQKQFTIVMCDIDWFKKINDQYGHDCGDYILTGISDMIRDSVAECGFASRWGGEEFLLIYEVDFAKAKEKVEALAKQIRENEFSYNEQQLKVTMTFGVKEAESGVAYEETIKAADERLYVGKRDGRNQIVY